jgi:hypothetical protein
MRAVVWAGRHGAAVLARAAVRAAFGAGADLSTLGALRDVAREVGATPRHGPRHRQLAGQGRAARRDRCHALGSAYSACPPASATGCSGR